MKFFLNPLSPFDFSKLTHRIETKGRSASTFVDNGELMLAIRISDSVINTRITSVGTVTHPKLRVEVENNVESPITNYVEQLKEKISIKLGTEQRLKEVYKMFKNNNNINPIIEQFYGLPLPVEPNLYESLIKIIIGQQLNLTFASTLITRLTNLVGEEVDNFVLFPTPEKVSSLSYEDLRSLSFSLRKAEYVIDISREILYGSLKLEALRNLNNHEVYDILIKLRGIGSWTIESFLIFGLGRTNIVPSTDIGLRNALKKVYELQHQPSAEEALRFSEQWEPYKTYITFYLWEYLDKKD